MKKISIVGGTLGVPGKSGVLQKISEGIENLFPGDDIETYHAIQMNEKIYGECNSSDFLIWLPDFPNEEPKHYPKKKIGSVLICSKVIREGYTLGDAVSRIFKMNGNACIAIRRIEEKLFEFVLVDALGNKWGEWDSSIDILCSEIRKFWDWNQKSIRINSKSNKIEFQKEEGFQEQLGEFCSIIQTVAVKIETQRGGRYFGNASTRCAKNFSTAKFVDGVIAVSGRNTSKEYLSPEDFVFCYKEGSGIEYFGDNKPSVDTPIQLSLYEELPEIQYMIHGHAYIDGATFTETYVACGDVREVDEILSAISTSGNCSGTTEFRINLKNHGFLIGTSSLQRMKELTDQSIFIYREI